jgi:hypothetical protein
MSRAIARVENRVLGLDHDLAGGVDEHSAKRMTAVLTCAHRDLECGAEVGFVVDFQVEPI